MYNRLAAVVVALLLATTTTTVLTQPADAQEVLFVDSGQTAVVRIAGPDRYATAAAVSAATFPSGATTVYVTTGQDFPDAVAAGASAAHENAPVLLVQSDLVPSATKTELARLAPDQIVLAGGTGVVSDAVASQLEVYAPVVRRFGADRYATAAALSAGAFAAPVNTVFIATGTAFPDALSVGAAAAAVGGPVLLVPQTVVPTAVKDELRRLDPETIVIAGGSAAVPTSIETELAGFADTVVRHAGADRYSTAAAISKAFFGTTLPAAHLATGENFPDGLSAVPAAAAAGGPVLLTRAASTPSPTIKELDRLLPRSAVLVGGDAVISADVAAEVAATLGISGGFAPPFVAGPFLRPPPSTEVPLARIIELETAIPTTVRIDVSDGQHSWSHTFDDAATVHALPVLGLRPDEAHVVDVTVIDADGIPTTSVLPLIAITDPLPSDFPTLSVTTSNPSAVEPGLTLFDVTSHDRLSSYLVVVDVEGDVRWFYDNADGRIQDARQLDNGDYLFNLTDKQTIRQVDPLGTVTGEWTASGQLPPGTGTPVQTDSFHHEAFRTDDDTTVTISSEVRSINGYPTSDTDLTPRVDPVNVVGDVIVEYEADGTIVGEWPLLDLLDPTRVGYDSFGTTFWEDHYPTTDPNYDWSHVNAVVPVPGGFLATVRHQDAIVRFDDDGDIRWILAPHENWTPPLADSLLDPVGSSFSWPYHPHAATMTPFGSVLVFDNGVYRASPPDAKQVGTTSRVVEYFVNENNGEVFQVWEYAPNLYAPFLGDADWLPETANVLAVFGALSPVGEGDSTVHIAEVSRSLPAQELWVLEVTDDNPSGVSSRVTYRAERIPGLYR